MVRGPAFVFSLTVGLASACSQDSAQQVDMPLRCDPGPSGPFWIDEGESLELVVSCRVAGSEPVTGHRFALDSLPPGANYDPATATISWLPGLDQAAVYDIEIAVPDLDESSVLRIGVADRWDHPDNVPIADPYSYPFEYGVPVFHLSPAPQSAEQYAVTRVIYGRRAYTAEAKKRGRTSLDYPKNSYTLKFPKNYLFSDLDRADGFVRKRRVVLTQHFDDNSYIRTRLAFDLWNALTPGIPVQSYTAVVYLDGEFWGIYTVTDHIDGDLMEAHGLSAIGNLYKAINHDANFRLTRNDDSPKQTLHDGYEKKEGLPEDGKPGAYNVLENLVQFVATADDDRFASEINERINMDDYTSWLLLATFIAADDSGSKNSYHYQYVSTPWRVVPWDFNASFGQTWDTRRRAVESVDYFEWTNELFLRMRNTPALASQIAQRFRKTLDGPWSSAALQARIEQYLGEIPPPVMARDQARWGDQMISYGLWNDRTDLTSPAEELQYIRTWLTRRWSIFDQIF
ncbi:MAG: CotH kinase family protein [Proteobacteria bacterium]|nr:CotH kinase family protein [Pseudomonadota bacterium]